jgi:hypothetical protein
VALKREKSLSFTLETVNGQPVSQSPLLSVLRHAGFLRAVALLSRPPLNSGTVTGFHRFYSRGQPQPYPNKIDESL